MDYFITWQFIVSQMERKYGIKPDSTKKYAYSEIKRCMDEIWNEYFELLYEKEQAQRSL